MAFSTSIYHCNHTKSFNLHLPFDNNALRFSHTKQQAPKLQVSENLVSSSAAYPETRLSEDTAEEDFSIKNSNYSVPDVDSVSRFSNLDAIAKRVGAESLDKHHLIQRRAKIGLNSAKGERFKRSEDKPKANNDVRSVGLIEIADSNNLIKVKFEQKMKKPKEDAPPASTTLRLGLDMCSKRGDIIGAIKLYDLAKRDGIKLGQYHYAVLLYLLSSAATGALKPAKSGSGARSLNIGEPLNEKLSFSFDTVVQKFSEIAKQIENEAEESNDALPNGEEELWKVSTDPESLQDMVESMKKSDYSKTKIDGTKLSESLKRAALKKGLEIHNEMLFEKIPMTEPILTSVARMAMAFGDGHMAFDTVKKMKDYGINPRLRSYGPALATFCNNGDVDSAFKVEEHMLENGVHPEEPELEALLRLSVEAGKSDKVYYVLHKLRTNVRRVSNTTADLIERWFKSKPASRIGKRKPDRESIVRTIEANGGAWHRKGWLGTGKWNVSRTNINSEGFCKNCREKLATIDLDPEETDNFARSVASIASQREKNSGFQKFQKWLDRHGPFEAVVDAANVGLYSQRKFKPSKVNAVVNGIRQLLRSMKRPLIVLHNRRVNGPEMDGPGNRVLVEKWKKEDALYLTPTGSNDDWYWLYAAIKCKCLIVTNDEMRDHLFQLLGRDFFPKWKERHQVRFGFGEAGPVFYMPPPCSVVVQESEKGHWHVPVVMSEDDRNEDARTWLCCTRSSSSSVRAVEDKRGTRIESESVLLSSDLRSLDHDVSVVQQLEDAEKLGGCVVDFQI